MNILLICGLQVTLVALVGVVIALMVRCWSRSAATLPIGATHIAVVLLTACAVSPWPSWLRREVLTDASQSVTPREARSNSPIRTVQILSLEWLNEEPSVVVELPLSVGAPRPAISFHWTWTQVLATLFCVGVAIGIARVFGGLWAVRIFVRRSPPVQSPILLKVFDALRTELGCERNVELRESSRISTAATVGWRQPTVLLSTTWHDWNETQLRAVLAHEISHITRGDVLATLIAQVSLVLHFYHPLVHWLVLRLRLEQELVADAIAAQVVGGPIAYLNAIGELALKQSSEPVGWPAHFFLPTRRTFLRRIEMLRDRKFLLGDSSRFMRWATVCGVAAMTLLAIGLRPPGSPIPQSSAQASPPLATAALVVESTLAQTAATPLEAKYVPEESLFVATVRPAKLAEQLRANTKPAAESDIQVMGLPLPAWKDCEQATVWMIAPPDFAPARRQSVGGAFTFPNKEARDVFLKAFRLARTGDPDAKTTFKRYEQQTYDIIIRGENILDYRQFLPDDRTALIASDATIEYMMAAGAKSLSPLTKSDSWKAALDSDVATALDAVRLGKLMATAPPNPISATFTPMWTSALQHTLLARVGTQPLITLTSDSKVTADAEQIEANLKAGVALLSNMLVGMKNSPDVAAKNAIDGIVPVINGHKLSRTGPQVTLNVSGDLVAMLPLMTLPVSQSRQDAQRLQQANSLKQVMIALHSYHDAHGHFPPAIVIDKESKVPRSWRVELLPFLDGTKLYDQYLKNEPWDSENNKKVLAQMPAVFRHPSQPKASTITSIVAAYGDGLMFQKDDAAGTKVKDITDGSSQTIALYEMNTKIPWTKPDEPFLNPANDVLPALTGFDGQGTNVAFADGFVRNLSATFNREVLKKMLTRAGGEVIVE